MERQRDWQDFFDQTERQKAARSDLIDKLDTDDRVKALLHALDELSDQDRTTKRLHNGTVSLSIKIEVIAWKLGRSDRTAQHYIDHAGATPYLAVSPSTHRTHTFLVRWPAIVDGGEPRGEMNLSGCKPATSAPGSGQVRGSVRRPARGEIRGEARGEIRGENAPKLRPEIHPSKPVLKKPVLQGSESKRPVLRPVGQVADRGEERIFPDGFWPWWRAMIASRNLSDPADIDELYALAVGVGCFPHSERNRFNVFAQAAIDRTKAATRGAVFRENVAFARWWSTLAADDEAERMIKQADADWPLTEELPEEPFDRATQIERLQAWQAAQPQ